MRDLLLDKPLVVQQQGGVRLGAIVREIQQASGYTFGLFDDYILKINIKKLVHENSRRVIDAQTEMPESNPEGLLLVIR